MSDKAAGPTLLQRAVMWILHAAMFYVVALYPVYLMARFEPDDIVHYGFLRWIAVVLVLYWAASQLLFTERPGETRTGRMLLAVTAAVVLVIGVFSPIVSFSFIGDVDYFREGYGDGYILLIMALLSLALAITGRWKQVLIPALGSLAVILWTFLGVQDTITQARAGGASELTGNPHEGLAASVMQSIQWEWGWVLLFAGSGLLVYSATRRDQWETASPPLVSVAVDDESETVAAEAGGATETETEIEPAEIAAAAPADNAAPASAESVGAAEPTEEAPAMQVEAADTLAEQAEETTAAPSEAPEPAAPEEETAASAQSVGAGEQKANGTETAPNAEASAPEPEPQPTEPDPQPEAAAAPATSSDETEAAAETASEEKAPATTEPAPAVAEAAPAPAGAPAEAAAEEKSESAPAEASESAPADVKKASTEEADSAAEPAGGGGNAKPAASDAEPPTDAKN